MINTAAIADSITEIAADEAFALLDRDPAAVLVDVRTKAEWQYVGVPDLSTIGKEVVFIEWQAYPLMAVDVDFVTGLSRVLSRQGVSIDAPILFICRSGVRSLAAAQALNAAGFTRCVNVAGGFEGPADASRHRGRTDGWKAKELPWIQS
jgi:rhodanese-related sulfurtransferase